MTMHGVKSFAEFANSQVTSDLAAQIQNWTKCMATYLDFKVWTIKSSAFWTENKAHVDLLREGLLAMQEWWNLEDIVKTAVGKELDGDRETFRTRYLAIRVLANSIVAHCKAFNHFIVSDVGLWKHGIDTSSVATFCDTKLHPRLASPPSLPSSPSDPGGLTNARGLGGRGPGRGQGPEIRGPAEGRRSEALPGGSVKEAGALSVIQRPCRDFGNCPG